MWVLLGLFCIWSAQAVSWHLDQSFAEWGVYPRKLSGLLGVVTMPFIHGDLDHIWNNSFGLLVTGWILIYAYPQSAKPTLLISLALTGWGVWLFGRSSYHIGASGIVYALTAFIFFSSIFRRSKQAIGYGLIVSFFFGASIWGILPFQKGISWEGHLAGAIAGLCCALLFLKKDQTPEEKNREPRFKEPKHWPVSEVPYIDGSPLADMLPQEDSQPAHQDVRY